MSPRVHLLICLALALSAGAETARRVWPIAPFLELRAIRTVRSAGTELWDVRVTARGAEPIDEVRVEPLTPGLEVVGPGWAPDLRSGYTRVFRFHRTGGAGGEGRVRVTQRGRVSRSYEVALTETP